MRVRYKQVVLVISCGGVVFAEMLNFWPTCEVFSMAITLAQMFQLKQSDLRYILQWSGPDNDPNLYLGNGLDTFLRANCSYANCYVTKDKRYFYGTDDFDAIIFDVKDLQELNTEDFPPKRCWRQKYILSATEAADMRPICPKQPLNNFFNWTWTYKLNSDLPRPHITVFEIEGEPIGPNIYMPWVEDQASTNFTVTIHLKAKSKAVAWFADECQTKSNREAIVKQLSRELKQYDLTVDIYGRCGSTPCSEGDPKCLEMLRKHYFFYLAFESSLAPDFVTGSVVTAFENYVVPIVYGEADYNRFLPPGSYLDAKVLGAQRLAREIMDTISHQTKYENFFRWTSHYKIARNDLTTDVCGLCSIMNEPELLVEETTYTSIEKWFNVDSKACNHDKGLDTIIESNESYEDITEANSKPKPRAEPDSQRRDNLEKSPKYELNLTMTEDDSNSSESEDR